VNPGSRHLGPNRLHPLHGDRELLRKVVKKRLDNFRTRRSRLTPTTEHIGATRARPVRTPSTPSIATAPARQKSPCVLPRPTPKTVALSLPSVNGLSETSFENQRREMGPTHPSRVHQRRRLRSARSQQLCHHENALRRAGFGGERPSGSRGGVADPTAGVARSNPAP